MKPTGFIALCGAAVLLMSGCGGSAGGGSGDTVTTAAETSASETTLAAAELFDMLKSSGLCGEMDTVLLYGSETYDNACTNLYGVKPDEITDGGVMFVGAGTLADEVSVLSGRDGLADILKHRAESRAAEYGGYAPAEQQKAEKAVVFEHKGLAVLVISDRAEEIRKQIISM